MFYYLTLLAMLAFVSTRKSKSRFGSTPMRRIFHSLFWGYTAGLFYGPLTKVSRFEDVCNLDDSYFAKVARDMYVSLREESSCIQLQLSSLELTSAHLFRIPYHSIRTHPEAKDIMQVIHFDSPDVQRNLYLQPNYRHSGFPAIITTPVNEPAPEGAIFLPEKDFLNEAVWAWNKKTEQENMTEENAAKLGDLDEWRVPKYLQDVGVDVYLMPPRRPTKS